MDWIQVKRKKMRYSKRIKENKDKKCARAQAQAGCV
jgi:hypothetical protein